MKRRRSQRLVKKANRAETVRKRQRGGKSHVPELPPEMWHEIVRLIDHPRYWLRCGMVAKHHPLAVYARQQTQPVLETMDLFMNTTTTTTTTKTHPPRNSKFLITVWRLMVHLRRCDVHLGKRGTVSNPSHRPFTLAFWLRESFFKGLKASPLLPQCGSCRNNGRFSDHTASILGRTTDFSIGLRMDRVRVLFFYHTTDRRVHTVVFSSHRAASHLGQYFHHVLDELGLPSHVGGCVDTLVVPYSRYEELEDHARELFPQWLTPPTPPTRPPTRTRS